MVMMSRLIIDESNRIDNPEVDSVYNLQRRSRSLFSYGWQSGPGLGGETCGNTSLFIVTIFLWTPV